MSKTHFMHKMTSEERSEYMRSIRAKVKSPGLANVSKERRIEIARMGGKASRKNETKPPQEKDAPTEEA